MTYSVGDFIQDGERWVIPYEAAQRHSGHKAVVHNDKTKTAWPWGIYLYGLPMGGALTASGAMVIAVEKLNAPDIFCHTPAKCAAAGRCTKEICCND